MFAQNISSRRVSMSSEDERERERKSSKTNFGEGVNLINFSYFKLLFATNIIKVSITHRVE